MNTIYIPIRRTFREGIMYRYRMVMILTVFALVIQAPFRVFAGQYDVRIQDIHARGMLNEDYENLLCSTTRITMSVPALSTQSQIFLYHTPTEGDAGVFDFKRDRWVFSGGTVTFNPWYRYNDGVPDCAGSYTPAVTGTYALYKSFSFPADIPVDSSVRKLIVLIHGWNPDELQNPYEGYGWPALVAALDAWVNAHPDWNVLAYNWAEDAATGPILDLSGGINILGNAIRNGTQAAEISHQHGQHLGPLIKNRLPNLEQIQFIAHSAGTWNARASAIYLSQNYSSIRIQVTLLDPYIPGEAPDADSDCTIDKINALATLQHVYLLENYFYANDVVGTESSFGWRPEDINRKLGSSFLPNPFNHMAPLAWYSGTITENAADGWSHSLAFNDTPEDTTVSIVDRARDSFTVFPPFPNPCNPATTITYMLGCENHVRLTVYDILGRETAVLEDGMKSAGFHSAVWNGTDRNGGRLGSGIYPYRITAGPYSSTGKILLVR
ncbi:hypothetical protein LLG96_06835 [bacterium]|nr:hypothetical protein [bacterium]